ncbi:MAG: putative arabinose efflux permease, MFS family [Chloroflexi bacterium]|nr:MAG: putative arabinose efflux permease, MFS family [Chloroflexota bacterium]
MSFGLGIIVPAIPHMAKQFGVSEAFAAQVITAQGLGRVLALMPAGIFVDRIGRRATMAAGSGLVAVGGILAASTDSFFVLLFTQFLWGVGNSVYMVGRELAAVDLIEPHQRGRFLSILFGLHSAGMAFGPVLGGVLTDRSGLDILFLVYGGAGFVAMLLALSMKETKGTVTAVKASFLGFGKLSGIDSYYRLTYIILMVVAVSAIMRMAVVNSMLPLHSDELGYSATEVGSIFLVFSAMSLLIMFPGGWISDKMGRKAAVVPAAFISAAVFAALPFTSTLSQIMVLVAFMGIANGMSLGSLTSYTYDIAPEGGKGRYQAQRRLFGEFGGFASPIIAGGLLAYMNPGLTFAFFAPVHLLAGVLVLFLAKESVGPRRKAPM